MCSVLDPYGLCAGSGLFVDSVVGGYGGRGTPGPIPNPVAKPSCADGTALDRVWESRSLPTFNVWRSAPGFVRERFFAFRGHIAPRATGPVVGPRRPAATPGGTPPGDRPPADVRQWSGSGPLCRRGAEPDNLTPAARVKCHRWLLGAPGRRSADWRRAASRHRISLRNTAPAAVRSVNELIGRTSPAVGAVARSSS